MKTKLITILQLVLLSVVLSSCNSDLEEEVFSDASPNNYFTSKGDVTSALNGMYDSWQVCCGGYEQDRSFILNTVSDEGAQASRWGALDALTYSPTNTNEFGGIWRTCYLSISAANFVTDNAEKIEALESGAYANAVLGEARFMRAHAYFDLVRIFGGVPLRTAVPQRADELDIPRNTEEEVYTQIIADLEFAAANLPPMAEEAGRPTSGAAKSYLAKVHLTRGDFPKALTLTQDVVGSGTYDLVTPFSAIFDVQNENNEEVIFDIQYVRVNLEGSRIPQLATGNNTQFAQNGNGGWGLQWAEEGLFEKYKTDDDRRNTTFTSLEPHPTNGLYYFGKWRDPSGVTADGHENNYITLRFADVVLMQAEAANEVNGPTEEAYTAFNKIRERALLPNLTEGLSKEQFRDSVLFERHLELALEQHRWFDLKRTGKLEEVMLSNAKPWDPKYLLFPIRQNELDASTVLEQNPGY